MTNSLESWSDCNLVVDIYYCKLSLEMVAK
jgi:hypothetical protein